MSESDNKSTIVIRDLKDKHFTVESYQRGYKWSVQQVLDLLNDISSFNNKEEAFYCLQPLALVQVGDSYEVIDGQQRLTTIYIILSLLGNKLYEISYRTRTGSEEFLKNVSNLKDEKIVSEPLTNGNILKFEKAVEELWKNKVASGEFIDNSDNYHFYLAINTVLKWANENKDQKQLLLDNLHNHTRFIWYLEPNNNEAKIVFRNLNSGKIGLTNAELIKAEIINSIKHSNPEIEKIKKDEIATEWDFIEKELHDDDFWYFLNNDTNTEKYETRIDLLFELLVGKPPKDYSDSLFTYREFTSNKERNYKWDDIRILFYQLQEWYQDAVLYHYIGYLIYHDICSINDIRSLSKSGKKAFREKLLKQIKEDLKKLYKKSDDYILDILDYHETYDELKKVLLLYNLELYKTSSVNIQFPFSKLKKQKWTLEHIHAQRTEDFTFVEEVENWIIDIQNLKKSFQNKLTNNQDIDFPDKKFDNLSNLIAIEDKFNKISSNIKDLLGEINDELSSYFNMHNLSNMALLDGPTNSSLSNDNFKSKRKKLIDIDKRSWNTGTMNEKAFIPIGTKNVFLKYTSSDINQLEVWGWQDREDYYNHIKETIEKYLPAMEVK